LWIRLLPKRYYTTIGAISQAPCTAASPGGKPALRQAFWLKGAQKPICRADFVRRRTKSRLESRLAARTGGGTTPSNSKISSHSGLCGAADGRRRSLDNGSSQCEELLQIFITHTANAGIDIFGVQQLSPRLVFPYPCEPRRPPTEIGTFSPQAP